MGQRKLSPRSTAAQRASAVALYRLSGRPAREVAAELGVNRHTMESWIRDARRAEADPEGTLSYEQRAELMRLMTENALLKREVEFLKKADALSVSDGLCKG
jgi:transposase-like protein